VIRLVQLRHPHHGRYVAIVEEPLLRLLEHHSVYDLAREAMANEVSIAELLEDQTAGGPTLNYDEIYGGRRDWSLLPCFDHPTDAAHCLVTGTGLTHKASAESRQSMHLHADGTAEPLTDSMKMYRIGLEGGAPPPGVIGAAPEWFYKGTGRILRAHGEPLDVPSHGFDGGEEAEIAGLYMIERDGQPFRVGLAQANEFSDHVLEAQNYLYLSASKLRQCSMGPELIVGHDFEELRGRAAVERGGKVVWESGIASGRRWMSHTLANLEHHHFKHVEHRNPGDAHIHFLGADVFSFRDQVRLDAGDEMVVSYEGMGRALRNPLRIEGREQAFVEVKVL